MILLLKGQPSDAELSNLTAVLAEMGLLAESDRAQGRTLLTLTGDTACADADRIRALPLVERVLRVEAPFKRASRRAHPQDSAFSIGGGSIGGGAFRLIAGPCAVESEEQIGLVAEAVKAGGASMLRGGAFKPRTSPYAFQGLRAEGLRLLVEAGRRVGLPVISELTEIAHLPLFEQVDVIQIGARNMQNFELLKELSHCGKPVLLKRSLSATLAELLMSAEYLLSGGNARVILCERGIRTFETGTRSTLDLSAVPALKELSHLPVVVDPSHAVGRRSLVLPMARAAAAAGADGIMVEVHGAPACALCDGQQAITPSEFAALSRDVRAIRGVLFQ